eukprot:s418_g30.t1
MSSMTGHILVSCQGQRKSHNAVFDLEMDQNSMYRLVLKVSSRNGAGISGGSEVVVNYGLAYDLGQGNPWSVDEGGNKRYKATLHDFFAKAAGVHVEEPVPTVVKAEQPVPKPAQTAAVPKPLQPPAPVPKPPAVATKAGQPAEPTMPKAPPAAVSEPVVIRDMEDPPLRVTLEDGRIVFTTLSEKNRRLSKYSVLAEFAEGRMTSEPVSGQTIFPWTVSVKSMVCVEGKIQSLASLIKDRKLQSVYLREAFTEGVPPKELKPRASS